MLTSEAERDLHERLEDLSRPEAFPHRPQRVEVGQTHISALFFADERVYKLKKPVKLPFIDSTTIERRRHWCEEELRLNRRLAPDVYLGLVAVVRGADGRLGFVHEAEGREALDWAVEMRRLPAERMLDVLLARNDAGENELERLTERLVGFHAAAASGPAIEVHGRPQAVLELFEENLRELVGLCEGRPVVIAQASLEHLADFARRFVRSERELLLRRVAEGRIREGHGDLHAGNVCLADEGIQIYDCVEFEPAFRYGDVALDLAFLAMDLDHRGHAAESRHVVESYARLADDPELPRLVRFYATYRALVRAKVDLITASDGDLPREQREHARREARAYGQLAIGYSLPPTLVLSAGLPATGKSFLGVRLAERLAAPVLRSDVVRKEEDAPPDYGPGGRMAVYAELALRASAELARGSHVLVDATFAQQAFREPFQALAARNGAALALLLLEIPEALARERLERRAREANDPSDADWTVYQALRESFEPPDELAPDQVLRLDGRADPADSIDAFLAWRLACQGPAGNG